MLSIKSILEKIKDKKCLVINSETSIHIKVKNSNFPHPYSIISQIGNDAFEVITYSTDGAETNREYFNINFVSCISNQDGD